VHRAAALAFCSQHTRIVDCHRPPPGRVGCAALAGVPCRAARYTARGGRPCGIQKRLPRHCAARRRWPQTPLRLWRRTPQRQCHSRVHACAVGDNATGPTWGGRRNTISSLAGALLGCPNMCGHVWNTSPPCAASNSVLTPKLPDKHAQWVCFQHTGWSVVLPRVLSLRQKVESPCLTKRRLSAFYWPRQRWA